MFSHKIRSGWTGREKKGKNTYPRLRVAVIIVSLSHTVKNTSPRSLCNEDFFTVLCCLDFILRRIGWHRVP